TPSRARAYFCPSPLRGGIPHRPPGMARDRRPTTRYDRAARPAYRMSAIPRRLFQPFFAASTIDLMSLYFNVLLLHGSRLMTGLKLEDTLIERTPSCREYKVLALVRGKSLLRTSL